MDVVVPPDPPDPPDPPPSLSIGNKRRYDDSDADVASSKKNVHNREQASASIQSVYLNPKWVIGITAYSDSEKGPFIVQVARTEPDPSAGTTIRPIKFGQFLVRNKIQNQSIVPDGVKKVGRNKISVEFNNATAANNFLQNPVLAKAKFLATIPSYNITRMGIVRNVPVDFSMDEFVESVNLLSRCGEILKARRLNRKVTKDNGIEYVPTQTVVITFHGQYLPEKIFSFHTSLPVEKYIYPTIQCMTCCRFGHIKAQCRSKPRCYRCGQEHTGDSCHLSEADSNCLYCSGDHFATSKCCPEQDRQRDLKMIMARDGVSYEEAALVVPNLYKKYSDVVQSSPTNTQLPNTSSLTSQRTWYPKTVLSSPRPRVPLGKGYDKIAHHTIVSPEKSTMPNGCALRKPTDSPPPTETNNNIVEIILTLLLNLISQMNSPIPSHVASQLSNIMSLIQNHGSSISDPVEHTKYTC